MAAGIIQNSDQTTGGWQCPYCAAWVMPNTYHACPMMGSAPSEPEPDYILTFSPTGAQILKVLREVSGKLDTLIEEITRIREDR